MITMTGSAAEDPRPTPHSSTTRRPSSAAWAYRTFGSTARRSGGRRTSQQTRSRSEEHTSELQSLTNLVCRLLLEKKKKNSRRMFMYAMKEKVYYCSHISLIS